MNVAAKLGLYALCLGAVFTASAFAADAIVPQRVVQDWTDDTGAAHGGGHGGEPATEDVESAYGLTVSQNGFVLTDVGAPDATGTSGTLSFVVRGPDGAPVTAFDTEHDKRLHLIVARSDGHGFRHVHPSMDDAGTWSLPWTWEDGGTYRVFADFVPTEIGEGITVSTTVDVAGNLEPVTSTPASSATVDDLDVAVQGTLRAGESVELVVTITRAGRPVTTLEPYLGAFGHLVALRESDLAYVHAHPHGAILSAGETSGPRIAFDVTAPSEGRYLLYLDFQENATVHSVPLVLDATRSASGAIDPTDDTQKEEDDHGH